ncbi:MAG: cache domain-containing protein [Candidatus Dadabacteria bacterium]|nr:cache domain-containing protein [Candidatus Dadabacteria bacterium]
MKNTKHMIFLFCVLGLLAAVSFHSFPASAHESDKHTLTAMVSDVSDDKTLKELVEHAAAHLSEATTFSDTLGTLNAFRNEMAQWNDGSTYLVLLTGNGGVYVHSRNRELEDQDWSQLQDADGKNVGQEFLKGGLVTYSAGKAYAHPFKASVVPFANTRESQGSQFVLVGGFDYEPREKTDKRSYEDVVKELVDSGISLEPTKKARQIGSAEKEDGEKKTEEERKQELKAFVEEAILLFTGAIVLPEIDPVRLRSIFRLDNGPWRYISTYIYIMDGNGNVIFNGANRNIEQTNLLADPDVGEDIARLIAAAEMPGGGFVNYNWENPAITGDGEQHGGPGGDSPKLGYTKLYRTDKDNPSAPVYIFGSGIYLGQSEDDGGCALSGTADSKQDAFIVMLIVVFAMLSVFFVRQSRRAAD